MKKIIYILLSFFMALVVLVCSFSFVGAVVTSSTYLKSVVVVSNYVKNVETEIAENLKSVAIPSGLPENFFNDKIKTDFIKNTVNESINSALSGKTYQMPNEEIEALILEDLLLYAKEEGVEINEESEKMLKETAKISGNYYKNYTYNIFYRALKHVKGISTKLLFVFVALVVVLVLMFYLLKGKKELIYALLSSGAMLIISVILIVISGAFKLAIKSVALLSFANFYIGILLAFITLIGIAAILYGTKKAKDFIK